MLSDIVLYVVYGDKLLLSYNELRNMHDLLISRLILGKIAYVNIQHSEIIHLLVSINGHNWLLGISLNKISIIRR